VRLAWIWELLQSRPRAVRAERRLRNWIDETEAPRHVSGSAQAGDDGIERCRHLKQTVSMDLGRAKKPGSSLLRWRARCSLEELLGTMREVR
jgi:hypothetical protein